MKAGRIFYVTLDPVDPAVCLPNSTNAASKHSHYYKNIGVDRLNKLSVVCVALLMLPSNWSVSDLPFFLLVNLVTGLDRTGRDVNWPSAR